MTRGERLYRLKTLLKIQIDDSSQDDILLALLDMAGQEVLNYMYACVGGTPEGIEDVPPKYEQVQIMAVVVGYGLMGVEGQTSHAENGISRQYNYSDMISYVHSNVIAYAGGMKRAYTIAE